MIKEIHYTFYHWGPFLYHTSLQPKELIKIKSLCNKDKKKDRRKNLAGLIKHEYAIDSKKMFPILLPYIKSYIQGYIKYTGWKIGNKITMENVWVNYMTKFESNPLHKHTGDLSFIVYTQIPEGLKEELNKNMSSSKPGIIKFMYKLLDNSLCINQRYIMPRVGDLLIFPSSLNHCVNHFKSEGERISVSGNLYLK